MSLTIDMGKTAKVLQTFLWQIEKEKDEAKAMQTGGMTPLYFGFRTKKSSETRT